MKLDDLPNEIILEIMSLLGRDVLKLCRVNTKLNIIGRYNKLYQQLILNDFGILDNCKTRYVKLLRSYHRLITYFRVNMPENTRTICLLLTGSQISLSFNMHNGIITVYSILIENSKIKEEQFETELFNSINIKFISVGSDKIFSEGQIQFTGEELRHVLAIIAIRYYTTDLKINILGNLKSREDNISTILAGL